MKIINISIFKEFVLIFNITFKVHYKKHEQKNSLKLKVLVKPKTIIFLAIISKLNRFLFN
jgi:hypothetical protein